MTAALAAACRLGAFTGPTSEALGDCRFSTTMTNTVRYLDSSYRGSVARQMEDRNKSLFRVAACLACSFSHSSSLSHHAKIGFKAVVHANIYSGQHGNKDGPELVTYIKKDNLELPDFARPRPGYRLVLPSPNQSILNPVLRYKNAVFSCCSCCIGARHIMPRCAMRARDRRRSVVLSCLLSCVRQRQLSRAWVRRAAIERNRAWRGCRRANDLGTHAWGSDRHRCGCQFLRHRYVTVWPSACAV